MNWKQIFRRNAHLSIPAQSLYALIDSSNQTLLAIGAFCPSIVFLTEAFLDTMMITCAPSNETAQIMRNSSQQFPEWRWNSRARTFKRTNPANITEDMRRRAEIAQKKMHTILWAMLMINNLRQKVNSGLLLQETIYAEKERQARAFKESAFDESGLSQYPYVIDFSQDASISPREAAEAILFQAQLDHEYLVKNEHIRTRLFTKIRTAATIMDMDAIMAEFLKNGHV